MAEDTNRPWTSFPRRPPAIRSGKTAISPAYGESRVNRDARRNQARRAFRCKRLVVSVYRFRLRCRSIYSMERQRFGLGELSIFTVWMTVIECLLYSCLGFNASGASSPIANGALPSHCTTYWPRRRLRSRVWMVRSWLRLCL